MVRPLSSTSALWRLPFGHFSESDATHRELRHKILARDGKRCSDCSLTFSRHMEVRHLDDDHENNHESNLVCVCPFCHLRDHLGPTGFASAGIVIGAPTLTQDQVNSLTIVIWYVQSRIQKIQDIRSLPESAQADTPEAWRQRVLNSANTIWNDLTTKSTRWTAAFSPLISEPDILGGILNELAAESPNTYAQRDQILQGLHILPLKEAFESQCADWFADLDQMRPLDSWKTGLSTLMERMETAPEEFYQFVRASMRAAVRTPPEALARPMGEISASASTPDEAPPDPPAKRGIGKRYQ